MINLRRLIKDINNGKHIISPVSSPMLPIRTREKTSESFSARKRTPSSLSYKASPEMSRQISSPGKKFLNIAEAIRSKSSLPGLVNSIRSRTQSKVNKNETSTKTGGLHAAIKAHARELSMLASQGNVSADPSSPLDASLIQAIFGQLLTWGLDPNIDQLCTNIGINLPGKHVFLGIQG